MFRARLLSMAAAAVFVVAANAQDINAEQQKLLAKRAAEADAYRKLAETVYGLEINSRTYVQDFVTESDDIRGEVDSFVKGVRLGTPTFYDDGSCEIPAEVTVAKVVEVLREAHSRYYHGSTVKAGDFESMTKHIEKQVIKVVGMGAPRPDLPPGIPDAALELLPAAPEGIPPAIPAIWKAIGPQARLSAKRAAELDAYRHLAERIKGLRLTSRTQVRDFVMESDTITAEMQAYLVGAQEKSTYYHNDELICECTFVVPTEQVIDTIKKLHSRHYKGDDIKGSDVESLVRTVVKREFEATGMGVPNPRFIQKYQQTAAVPMPDWSAGAIEAEGHGTDPDMSTPQGRLRAARAAEMDARRKLLEQIQGLTIRSETTVRDFVTEHDDIVGLMQGVIVDAVIVNTRFDNDEAIVRVALPGARVWQVVGAEVNRPNR